VTRTCPRCGSTYPDAVFFCGEDGAITIQDQDAADYDPRLGKQLGGYIVAARVADGAMGRVFEGRHPDTKARVAIKVLHVDVAKDTVALQRFKREFETTLEMSHPHIVKVLESGDTPDGSYFMTMEFLEGEELGKVLAGGQAQKPARVVRLLSQLAQAIDYAHSFGFIHRDLKPENIYLCKGEGGDDVRVLDFGSVKLQIETGAKLTAMGTTVGSPYYMAPEQAMGKADVDRRADVFSVGAVTYEMLTGVIAFEAATLALILKRIMSDMPKAPSEVDANLPKALDAVIEKAVAKEKTDRYGTTTELAQAVLAGFGLEPDVARWAQAPESEIDAAIALAALPTVAAPEAKRPSESPEPKESWPSPRIPSMIESLRPERLLSLRPAGVKQGLTPARLAVLAIVVAAFAGGLYLILK
jgi:serine/threonine-protein kinase